VGFGRSVGFWPQINPARPTVYVGPTRACLVTQCFSGVEYTAADVLLRSNGGELATRHVDFCWRMLGVGRLMRAQKSVVPGPSDSPDPMSDVAFQPTHVAVAHSMQFFYTEAHTSVTSHACIFYCVNFCNEKRLSRCSKAMYHCNKLL
jgi:hypothetical protein